MKLSENKTYIIRTLVILVLTISTLLCACTLDKYIIEENDYEYSYEYKQPFVDECDEGFVIDGKASESAYEGNSYYSHSMFGVTMSATTAFTDKGLYVAGKVLDNKVYCKSNFDFNSNSTIAFYIFATDRDSLVDLGVKNVRLNAKNVRSDTLTRVNAQTNVLGELNSGNSEGMEYEFFITWEELGVEQKPEKVYMLMEYNLVNSINASSGKVVRAYSWDTWDSPQTYFEFNENGYVNADTEDSVLGNSYSGIAKTSGWIEVEDGYKSVLGGANIQHKLFVKNSCASAYSFECVIKPNEALCGDKNPSFGLMSFDDSEIFNTMRIRMSNEDMDKNRIQFSILNNYGAVWNDSGIVWNDYGEAEYDADCPYPDSRNFADDGVKVRVVKLDGNFFYFINDLLVHTSYLNVHSGNVYAGIWSMNAGITVSDIVYTDYSNDREALHDEILKSGYSVIETATFIAGGVISGPSAVANGEKATFELVTDPGYALKSVRLNGVDVTDEVRATLKNGAFDLTVDGYAYIDYEFEKLVAGTNAFLLHGKVSDMVDSSDIEGATIQIVSGSNPIYTYSTESNAMGEFEIILPNDTYILSIQKDKYYLLVDENVTSQSAGDFKLERSDFGWEFEQDGLGYGSSKGNWSYAEIDGETYASISGVAASEIAYTYLNNKIVSGDFVAKFNISSIDVTSSKDSAPYVGFVFSPDNVHQVAVGLVFKSGDPSTVRFRCTSYSPASNQYYGTTNSPWNEYFNINKDLTAGDSIEVAFVRTSDGSHCTYYLYIDGAMRAIWSFEVDDAKNAITPVSVGYLTQGAQAIFSGLEISTNTEDVEKLSIYPYGDLDADLAASTTLSNGSVVNSTGIWKVINKVNAISANASIGAKRHLVLGGAVIGAEETFTLTARISGMALADSNGQLGLFLTDNSIDTDDQFKVCLTLHLDKADEGKIRVAMRYVDGKDTNAGSLAAWAKDWNVYSHVSSESLLLDDAEMLVSFSRAIVDGQMYYVVCINGIEAARWETSVLDAKGSLGEAAIGLYTYNSQATFKDIRLEK